MSLSETKANTVTHTWLAINAQDTFFRITSTMLAAFTLGFRTPTAGFTITKWHTCTHTPNNSGQTYKHTYIHDIHTYKQTNFFVGRGGDSAGIAMPPPLPRLIYIYRYSYIDSIAIRARGPVSKDRCQAAVFVRFTGAFRRHCTGIYFVLHIWARSFPVGSEIRPGITIFCDILPTAHILFVGKTSRRTLTIVVIRDFPANSSNFG